MIIIPVLAKQPLNVNWTVSIKRLATGTEHAGVAVIDYSDDNNIHSYIYDSLNDLTDDTSRQKTFDESTEVYKNASAVYGADDYNAPLEVIEIPKTNASSASASVSSSGSISESSGNSLSDKLLDALDSNVAYVVPTKDVSEKDIETITDALFGVRAGVVVYQTSDKNDMHNFYNHIQSTQSNAYGNAYGIFEDRGVYPAAQAAGYGYAHVPCDFMKIGNESEFEATDLTADQVKDVLGCNFNVIENRSDDLMLATDLAVNGSYIDQFANVKYIINDLTYYLQRFMNHNETPYNDQTIHNIKATVKTEINGRLAGLFIGRPSVDVATREQVSPNDIEKRVFRHITVAGEIFGDIENVDGKLNLTA